MGADLHPTCSFEHMGESFTPRKAVPADHPMVALRPDLFTTKATKADDTKETAP